MSSAFCWYYYLAISLKNQRNIKANELIENQGCSSQLIQKKIKKYLVYSLNDCMYIHLSM